MPTTIRNTDILFNDGTTQLTAASAIPNQQIFTSSGTFTVPAGVTRVLVSVWGGGGGGSVFNHSVYGAGSAGGYCQARVTVTPGASITVTVGSGGNGGFASTAGATGGTSSFGAFVSATGGGPTVIGDGSVSGATLVSRSISGFRPSQAADTGGAPGSSGDVGNTYYGFGGGPGFSGGGGGGGGSSSYGPPTGGAGGTNYGPSNNGLSGSNGSAGAGGNGGAGGSPGGTGGSGLGAPWYSGGGGGGGGGGVVVQW